MEDCCAGGNEVMILACAGGSNVGQLSNQAAVELTGEGSGKLFCPAGIGARLSGCVQSAKDVPIVAVIDGCQVGCGRAILKQIELEPAAYVVLTEEGIEKNKELRLDPLQVEKTKDAVKRAVSSGAQAMTDRKVLSVGACDCGGACC